jgi:hypothetical protein
VFAGTVVAFDKFMNLVMTDVEESYRVRMRVERTRLVEAKSKPGAKSMVLWYCRTIDGTVVSLWYYGTAVLTWMNKLSCMLIIVANRPVNINFQRECLGVNIIN